MRPVTIAYENSSDTFEILEKDTQTKDNGLKISQDTPKSRTLPLPRDLDQNSEGEIKSFTFCQELQDPGSPNSITIFTETTSDKNYPFNNSSCDFSNRYRYCKEVIKPCLKDDPPNCPSSIELLLKNAIKKTTAEFPDNPPYLICHRCKPPPSCPPKPKCCKPKNRLKICCGIDGTRTICKECTKANCPSFVRPKPYVPPCSPPLPCPPVCRPPCPLPACPPPCPPPPCPPRCSPPPCPPKCPPPPCPPPPCPPRCPPPPCPPPPCPPKCPPPPCPPPPCPPRCPPPPCPPRCPPPPCPPPPCPPKCPPPPCPPPPCPPRCPPPPCPPRCPPPPCPPRCPPPPCPPPPCPPKCPPPPCPPPPCPPRCPPPPCPPRCPPPPCPPPPCPPPPCPPPPCPPRCPPPPCPPKCPPPPCPPPPCPPKCPPRCPPPPCPPRCPPPPCPPKCPLIPCPCSQHSKSNVTKIVSCVKSLVGLGGQKFDCNCGAKECVAPKPKPCPPPPPYCPQPPPKCPEARSAKKFLCSSENPNSQNDLNAKPIENNSSSCSSNNLPPIVIAQQQQMGCIKCALTDNKCEENSSQEAAAALKSGVEGNVESLNNSIDLTDSKTPDGQKIPVKVSNTHKDAGAYNVVQLDTLDAEEKFLRNAQRQSDTRPDNSSTNFIFDKIDSAVSMISDTLDYELPRPIKSKSFFKQNCEIPTASQPQTPTGVSNIMMGSYNLFSSIQEAIFSMFNEDDHTTVSSGRSSTSLASESDENILSKMID